METNLSWNELKQNGKVIWLSGLPCSGKTTIGIGLAKALSEAGYLVRTLDGDITRKGICSDLGFSINDRMENIRRVAEIARLFAETGLITICAFITPTNELRDLAGKITGDKYFINVFVDAPLHICEQRDVKGMYRQAREGRIKNFTGVSAPFEVPENPHIRISTEGRNPSDSINELLQFLLPLINGNEK
jgi:adenylylsulfate kinase